MTFARQFLHAFGNASALVGFVTDDFPIGSWQKRSIDGVEYDFFALFSEPKSAKKPLIPRRLRVYFNLIKYRKKILEYEAELTVTRSPEVIVPISKWGYKKLVFYFAGTGNPLAISRRWYGRRLARFYDRFFFPSLAHVDTILAAADKENIADTIKRSA